MEEELYYPCSENKGADQLRSYCEADLRLLFSPMQIVGFPMWWLKYMSYESAALDCSSSQYPFFFFFFFFFFSQYPTFHFCMKRNIEYETTLY